MASQANSRSARNAAPLVVYHDPPGGATDWLRLLPAAFVSLVVNGLILGMLALIFISNPSTAEAQTEAGNAPNESTVQSDQPKEPESRDPLTITEVDPAAILPDMDIQYNVT